METSDSDSRSKIETRQFTFAELPDYSEISHFKPEGFKTPDNSFEISSWREAYRIFCRYLLKEKPRHLRAFKNLEETFLGRRIMFSNNPLLLTEAYQLRSGFYAEIFLPPKSIIHNISRLIQFCRLSPRQFAVSIPVYVDESELSQPEEVEGEQNEVKSQLAESEQPTEEINQENVSEQSAEQNSSVYKLFHFTLDNNIPDLDSTTPVSLTIGKSSFLISKWRDVIVETARYIVKNESESFSRYLYKNFGPKWNNSPLFSDKRSDLVLAHEIDSNLFVETVFNSADCVKKALLFIRYTNIKPSTVKIEYKPKETVSETASTQNASAVQSAEQGTEERRSSKHVIKTGGFIFTQSVNLSMFFTGIEIPAPCHKEFLDNLTVELKEGMSTPVTIWFNDTKYSATINYLTSVNPDTTPQIRFTWNSNLPIAIALRKACPESFQILEFNSHISNNEAKQEVSDTITITCASKRNEYILLINSQKTNSDLQEETAQPDEKPHEFQEVYYKYHSDTISELVEDDSDSTPEESVEQNKTEEQGVDSQSDNQQSVEDYDSEENELQEPPSHDVIPSGSARFTLDKPIPDLAFTKPVSIKIDRHLYTISTWREVLTLTVEYIAEYEPLSFKFLKEEFGKKSNNRPLLSAVPSYLLKPYKINQNIWVETNFNSIDCVKKAVTFLEFCYIKPSKVEIEYKLKESVPEPASTQDASAASSDVVQPTEPKVESPATFTKPLNLSMFFTCVVIPTQCHKAFLDNLTVDLKEGMSELVTLWFNDEKYKVVINNLFFSSADSTPQIRFTWNPNLPIAIALRKACPESFQVLERNSYSKSGEDKQEVSETITISCGNKPNEFILQVNSQKESEKLPEPNSEQTDSEKEPLNVESDQEKTVQPDETSQQQDKFGEIYCKYQPETSSKQTEGESSPNPEVSEALSQPENEKQESVSQSDELQQPKEDSNTEESGIQESASSNAEPSGLSCFKLNGSIPNLTYCKPVSISIDNQKRSVSTWRQILTVIVNYLCQHELLSFRYLTKQQRVSKQNRSGLFSNTPLDFIQPYEVESGLWIETNFSANDCIKKAVLCLNECLVDKSRFEVEYASQDYVAAYRPENAENAGKDSASDAPASQSKAEDDYTSFTKPVNKSMFNMCIVIPMQCHKAFFSHLSNVPKVGESVPVTLWLNNLSYSVTMHNLSFPVCNASPQVRFTWTPSSSIAHALIEECPESYRLFQSGAHISRQDAPDTVTVSCGNKLDEFILQVNSQKTSGVIQEENPLQEENSSISDPNQILSESDMISEQLIDEFGFTPEERDELVKQIEELVPEVFPNGSCREAQLQLLLDRLERLTTIDSLERFLIQNNIAILSRGWLYFLTDKVQAGLFEVLRQMEQEGQILADYNLLYEKKLDLFDSINVYKNEEVISKLFIALMAKNGSQAEIRCYPTDRWLALKENATIKDALIDCFSRQTVLSYYQLNNELPYIPIDECRYVISHEPDFIKVVNNVYTIRDRIIFDDQLRDKLNALVQSEVEKNMYISCARLDLSEAMEFNPEISQSALLDYYCQELMPKRYKRKGNVISDAENPTDSSTIISSYCQSKSCVTYDELKNLAFDLSANEQTALYIATDLLVRVDKDHYIDPKLIHFDVDEIDRVLDTYIQEDYIPLQDVYSFSSFPICDSQRPWNWFLLESFCRKYSKQFGFMVAKINSKNVGVIVRKSAKYDDYYTLMATAVIKSEIELSGEAISRFLFQGHYIAVSNSTLIQRVLEKARILSDSEV